MKKRDYLPVEQYFLHIVIQYTHDPSYQKAF